MATLIARGGTNLELDAAAQRQLLQDALAQLAPPSRRVLLVPPDITRLPSGAGPLTVMLYELLSPSVPVDVMPALGTHRPMTDAEIALMFGDRIPRQCFIDHDWQHALADLGEVPAALIREWSEGRLDYAIPIQVNERLVSGTYDLILSIGQVVPHEVIGMANYTKNICIGVGGAETINKSHFLGAVVGLEKILGRTDTAVRRALNHGFHHYLADLPIQFVLSVIGGGCMRGLYVGNDDETFAAACQLSQQTNLILLPAPLQKVVVYLDPREFKSTWLGNKAIYRTRMALADGGELIILAPGLREFGEAATIDKLIRRHGYFGTESTLAAVASDAELGRGLSAAAHLIHGTSDGRFRIIYCPGPELPAAAVRAVGYEAGDLTAMLARYDPAQLRDGANVLADGEQVFFVSNPAQGLWALRDQFAAGM